MTRTKNARIAGSTFLLYIVAGIASMVVFGRATSGAGIAAKLAGIAQHPTEVGIVVVLGFIQCFAALVLAVTLYAITREQDADLAMLALACRVGEGVIAGSSMPRTLALAWLATASGVSAPDTAAAHALGAYLLRGDVAVTATFFAVGSTLFSYLARPNDPHSTGLGGPRRVGPACDRPSPAGCGIPERPDHHDYVVAYAHVRSAAWSVANHQGRRHAGTGGAIDMILDSRNNWPQGSR
jgi:Domain of unknown function (DUF4386)